MSQLKNTKKTSRLVLTNTVTGKREEFRPQNPPKVLYYSCGPTVYGPLHVGNARALFVSDMVFRWLKHFGYDVTFVRNYTDVDDKIIDRAKKENVLASEISEKYIQYCEEDIRVLSLSAPTHTVKVTESMPDIIGLIQKIIDRGHAYVVDGEVLYSVRSLPSYGKLSHKNVDELQAGSRVDVDPKKRDPMDFSLWKPHKPGEPFWESPWGKGRPGWHIECSAMVYRWLGETIDLHHGGMDLIFPHHENEIAQTEAATGKEFCRHWLHHSFLTSGNEKMSKSLGNILTIREFNERYGPELLKFIFLSFQYRSTIPYTKEMMDQALSELERVYLAKKWAKNALKQAIEKKASEHASWAKISASVSATFGKIEAEMESDLNSPGAFGHLFTLIREINRTEVEVSEKPGLAAASTPGRKKAAIDFLTLLETKLSPLLNVFAEDAEVVLAQIEKIRRLSQTEFKEGALSEQEIQTFIDERRAARKAKDFKRSDEIRNQLDAKGIVLIDNPDGSTIWRVKY